jgi:pilus assembly protein Flp/PilA
LDRGYKRGKRVKNLLQRVLNDKSGVTSVEYALIAALVAIAIIVGARMLGSQVSTTFNTTKTTMKTA